MSAPSARLAHSRHTSTWRVMKVFMGRIKVYQPLSSEINLPKLTSTTFGFPGRIPLLAAPGSGAMKAVQSESFASVGEGLPFRRQDRSPLAEGDGGAEESEAAFSGDGPGEGDDGSRTRYSGTDLMKDGLGGRGGAVD